MSHKRKIKRGLAIVGTAFLVLVLWPSIKEELSWNQTWNSWQKQKPQENSHLDRTVQEQENFYLYDIMERYGRYASSYPDGKYRYTAEERVWQAATFINKIKAYNDYLKYFPKGRFYTDANLIINELKKDDRIFDLNPYIYDTAPYLKTKEELRYFIDQYPGHKRENAARSLLENFEVYDFKEILEQTKIEIIDTMDITGVGGESVSLTPGVKLYVRNRHSKPLLLHIPVGMVIKPYDHSHKSMLVNYQRIIAVYGTEWITVSLHCAWLGGKRFPKSEERCRVVYSPFMSEIQSVIPLFEKQYHGNAMHTAMFQATVWIITQNTLYDDLGDILYMKLYESIGSRIIFEREVVEIMKLCEDAGMDITKKAIWQDRKKIYNGLPEGPLRKWLGGKFRTPDLP